MDVAEIVPGPSTSSVSVSAEPEVGHKGVSADESKVDLMELEPRFDNLTTAFKSMLSEETGRLWQQYAEIGTSTGKDLHEIKDAQAELLDLLRRAQAHSEKEHALMNKVDFATSPILVARMECGTSPIPFVGIDRGLSPIELKKFCDAQIMSSPLPSDANVRVTLLSPPRKRAMTPESVVGSYLSSHHSDDASVAASRAPHGDLSLERVWSDTGSPLSASSNLSATSTSSRQTVLHVSGLPAQAASRVSARRRVSSPPATIPGFNVPFGDDEVSPADSASAVGVPAQVFPVPIDLPEERSILLAPVEAPPSARGSIRMPIPLRAGLPFEGSLADFIANAGAQGASAEPTEVIPPSVVKVDQGTSPLTFSEEIAAEAPAPSIIEEADAETEVGQEEVVAETEAIQDEPVAATAEKGISPMTPLTQPMPPPEDEAKPETEVPDVPSTPEKLEKAISPIIPVTAPASEIDAADADDQATERASSPAPWSVPLPESVIEEPEMVEKAISPMSVVAPVPEEPVEEPPAEDMEEVVSPASTVRPLPTKVDAACETDPLVESEIVTESTEVSEVPVVPEAIVSLRRFAFGWCLRVVQEEQPATAPSPVVMDIPVPFAEEQVLPEMPALVEDTESPPDSPAPVRYKVSGPTSVLSSYKATPRLSPEYMTILEVSSLSWLRSI